MGGAHVGRENILRNRRMENPVERGFLLLPTSEGVRWEARARGTACKEHPPEQEDGRDYERIGLNRRPGSG